jgi:hypothetical protein
MKLKILVQQKGRDLNAVLAKSRASLILSKSAGGVRSFGLLHNPHSGAKANGRRDLKNLRGFIPRANYTDRASAACRRSWCQLSRIQGCRVVIAMDS